MCRKSFLAFILAFLLRGCLGLEAPISGGGADDDSGVRVSLLVVDAHSMATLRDAGGDDLVVPASTLKLATATMALETLRPEHRFITSVLSNGRTRNGRLRGDLILVGGGDPMLNAGGLMKLVLDVRRAGIREVAGRFLYDETLFAGVAVLDAGQPLDAAYNTGVGPLGFNFNRALMAWDVTWREPSLTPSAAWRERTRNPGPGTRGRVSLPVRNPGLLTAETFRDFAGVENIVLPAPRPGEAGGDVRVVGLHRSAPLSEIIRAGLEYSNNMIAELVGLGAVKALGGDVSSLEASARAMRAYYRDKLPGLDWVRAVIPNHSGLSASARVTPRQMLAILHRGGDCLMPLLPAAGFGEGQPLSWSHPGLAGRLWAKSGTLRYARGVVGRLYAKSGRALDVALYIQDLDKRAFYDRERRSAGNRSAADRAGDAWIKAAKAREAQILLDLYNRY